MLGWISADPLPGGNAVEADIVLPLAYAPGRADRHWRNLKTTLRRVFGNFHRWPDLGPPHAALIDPFDANISAHDALWVVCRNRPKAAMRAGAICRQPIESPAIVKA